MSFKLRAFDILDREIIRLETKSKEAPLNYQDLQLLSELVSTYAKLGTALEIRKNNNTKGLTFKATTDQFLVDGLKKGLARYGKPDRKIGERSAEYDERLDE